MNSDQYRNLLWVIILLLVTLILGIAFLLILLLRTPGAGVGGGSSTQAAETPVTDGGAGAPTQPAPPAPTPIPGDPAIELGLPAWTDNFSSSENWVVFDNDCFRSEIRDGRFWMTGKGQTRNFCWELTWPRVNRFYLETLVRSEEVCAEGGAFGLFFRGPDTNRGYLFGLTCETEYGMYLWTGENGALIVQPQTSPELSAGEESRLGVLVEGETYSLYINGVFQTQVQDKTFTSGDRIGFFIRSPESETAVSFDNLTYWNLP